MICLKRTKSSDKNFKTLILELDNDLISRYDNTQYQYDAFTKIGNIETVLLAYMDNTAVGCSCFIEIDENTVEIKRMFVNPYLRGMGIASSLLKELLNWAQELNYTKAVTETGVKQPESIKLCEKNGFVQIENFGPYVGVNSSICMGRDLNRSIQTLYTAQAQQEF